MTRSKGDRKRRAEERKQLRQERTPAEQLAMLDDRLGVGVGAERERERLTVSNNCSNPEGESND